MTVEAAAAGAEDWRVEVRYRAVLDVLAGVAIADVARRHGACRQSVYSWTRRYRAGGLDALRERSRRPHRSPRRLATEQEALICELRHAHARWGARRIVHELRRREVAPPRTPQRSPRRTAAVRR